MKAPVALILPIMSGLLEFSVSVKVSDHMDTVYLLLADEVGKGLFTERSLSRHFSPWILHQSSIQTARVTESLTPDLQS